MFFFFLLSECLNVLMCQDVWWESLVNFLLWLIYVLYLVEGHWVLGKVDISYYDFSKLLVRKTWYFFYYYQWSLLSPPPPPPPQPPSHWGYWVLSWKIFAIYEFFLSLYQWIQNLGWTNIFGITLHLHCNVQHWMRNRCAIIFRFLSKIKLSFNKYSTKFLRWYISL